MRPYFEDWEKFSGRLAAAKVSTDDAMLDAVPLCYFSGRRELIDNGYAATTGITGEARDAAAMARNVIYDCLRKEHP